MPDNWVQQTVTLDKSGQTGTMESRGYNCIVYDDVRRKAVAYAGYYDSGLTPYNTTIYSNMISSFDFLTGVWKLEKLNNWQTSAPSSPWWTTPLSANATDPTPVDRHPYYCFANGKVYLLAGISFYPRIILNFATTDVNTGTSQIALSALQGLSYGSVVRFTSTGTLPAPLATATDYYVFYVDSTHIKLCTSLANVQSGTTITLTTQGTGTHTLTRFEGNHPIDIWKYDPATAAWTQIHMNPNWFTGTGSLTAAACYDPIAKKIVICNLTATDSGTRRTWLLDVQSETMEECTGTSAQGGTAPDVQSAGQLCYDSNRQRVWCFGGGTFGAGGQELRWFDCRTKVWTTVTQGATKPDARTYHAVMYLPNQDQILVCGGVAGDAGTRLTDTWIYDIQTNVWTQLSTAASPFASGTGNIFNYACYDWANDQVICLNNSNQWWALKYTGAPQTQNMLHGHKARLQYRLGSQRMRLYTRRGL